DIETLPGDRGGFVRQFDRGDAGTRAREAHGIGTEAASDLEDPATVPPGEIRERRNVRLDEILAPLHLIEVIAGTNRLRRMADVARPRIPVVADPVNRYFCESLINVHSGLAPRPTGVAAPRHRRRRGHTARTRIRGHRRTDPTGFARNRPPGPARRPGGNRAASAS